jgi:hypothetical protein
VVILCLHLLAERPQLRGAALVLERSQRVFDLAYQAAHDIGAIDAAAA